MARLRCEATATWERLGGSVGELLARPRQQAARDAEVRRDLGQRLSLFNREMDGVLLELRREGPPDPYRSLAHGPPRPSLAWLLSRCPLFRGTPARASGHSRSDRSGRRPREQKVHRRDLLRRLRRQRGPDPARGRKSRWEP